MATKLPRPAVGLAFVNQLRPTGHRGRFLTCPATPTGAIRGIVWPVRAKPADERATLLTRVFEIDLEHCPNAHELNHRCDLGAAGNLEVFITCLQRGTASGAGCASAASGRRFRFNHRSVPAEQGYGTVRARVFRTRMWRCARRTLDDARKDAFRGPSLPQTSAFIHRRFTRFGALFHVVLPCSGCARWPSNSEHTSAVSRRLRLAPSWPIPFECA